MASQLCDADIRPALIRFLMSQLSAGEESVVLEELGVRCGQSRADVAVVNGHIHGYEIKSPRDSLRRLTSQACTYSKCFDRATVVVSSPHVRGVEEILPAWWGILIVEATNAEIEFVSYRQAADNPSLDFRVLAEFLWRDDALALLQRYGLSRGLSSKPRGAIWDRIFDQLPPDAISAAVRAKLKARKERSDQLPRSRDGESSQVASTPQQSRA